MHSRLRLCAFALSAAFGGSFAGAGTLAAAKPLPAPLRHQVVYRDLKLANGMTATVYGDGVAQIFSRGRRATELRIVRRVRTNEHGVASMTGLPSQSQTATELSMPPPQAFRPQTVVVVFRAGVAGTRDRVDVDPRALAALRDSKARTVAVRLPAYTNDAAVNRTLAALGVDRSERLFRRFGRSQLAALAEAPRADGARLDFSKAYLLHVTAASSRTAMLALRKLPSIAYASLDWNVSPMNAAAIPIDSRDLAAARTRAWHVKLSAAFDRPMTQAALPANYAISASAQSFLNSSDVEDVAAYDEIVRHFNQLPGTGEVVTNVSLGDADDASAAANGKDKCNYYAATAGPTTEMIGKQRYLNWPSMPLIPVYLADADGSLSGSTEVCGVDPYLEEVGLDFAMMAPLPDSLQRSGEQGSGFTDLLGIAPGATYRLVMPSSGTGSTDIDAALLAAATQSPRPNVITASLGFGEDQYGFPGRYLEDDPLTESIVASIVQQYHIVVCISANDGLRTLTYAAVSPSGGAAPTDVAAAGTLRTDLSDIAFSTVPSRDFDSGSIDVGGTTTDDVFAVPPQYAATQAQEAQHFYPETRFTGFTSFASGFGTRVNVSAPSDNLVGFEHQPGGADDAVTPVLTGGTSGSAPQVAAAAAVALQVARLTGHPFANPLAVRSFLETTGAPVPQAPQADRTIAIGTELDLRNVVEQLFRNAGIAGTPRVARVGIEQRRFDGFEGDFQSDTDPSNINMSDQPGSQYSWITLAPDWEFMPAKTHYRLYVNGKRAHPIVTTPTARLQAQTILTAAGLPFASTSAQTVKLTYEAARGAKILAAKTFSLTFAPTSAAAYFTLAPRVAPVSDGKEIAVTYDYTNAELVLEPELMVSEPGRVDPQTGQQFHPAYTIALTKPKGTVRVPVSALQGAGIYGIAVRLFPAFNIDSDFAYTRVAPAGLATTRPPAPLLSSNGSEPSHDLEIPYGASFQVHYDVSGVAGATGGMLEISAPGPGVFGIDNPFNNPNGTIRDDNGVDGGSVAYLPLSGTKGTVTLDARTAGLLPAMQHVVRVIPMRFGAAAGEGGEVSTIAMDGIRPADGGSPENGWSIAQNGLSGFLTSSAQTAAETLAGSVESFDQTTNQITGTIASNAGGLYFTNSVGLFANDLGLIGWQPNASSMEREVFWYGANTSTYTLLDPASAGTISGTWTPPLDANDYVAEIATNQTSDTVPIVLFNELPNSDNADYSILAADLQHGTFGQRYDMMAPLQSMQLPSLFGLAQDTTTNVALAAFGDFYNSCAPPAFERFDLGSGALTSFTGAGTGFVEGLAIDSSSGIAAYTTECDYGLVLYNMSSGTSSEVKMPSSASANYVAADPVNHRFLVAAPTDAGFPNDNNTLSNVLVYDESGNLLETIHRFNFYNIWLTTQNQIQVNPYRHTGYAIGPANKQIVPFAY